MSPDILAPPSLPAALATRDGAAVPTRPKGATLDAGLAPRAGPAVRDAAQPAAAEAIRIEPEVYCRMRGQGEAARGLPPCSDLGCTGCTPAAGGGARAARFDGRRG